MSLLEAKNKDMFDLERILVEVYPSPEGKDNAEEIFLEVNKAEPVSFRRAFVSDIPYMA
jgi:hypothetical protein